MTFEGAHIVAICVICLFALPVSGIERIKDSDFNSDSRYIVINGEMANTDNTFSDVFIDDGVAIDISQRPDDLFKDIEKMLNRKEELLKTLDGERIQVTLSLPNKNVLERNLIIDGSFAFTQDSIEPTATVHTSIEALNRLALEPVPMKSIRKSISRDELKISGVGLLKSLRFGTYTVYAQVTPWRAQPGLYDLNLTVNTTLRGYLGLAKPELDRTTGGPCPSSCQEACFSIFNSTACGAREQRFGALDMHDRCSYTVDLVFIDHVCEDDIATLRKCNLECPDRCENGRMLTDGTCTFADPDLYGEFVQTCKYRYGATC